MTWPCQASEHDADHGEPDEGGDGARISLEITRQAAMAANPGQGSFDDPALGQDNEFVQFVAELTIAALTMRSSGAARGWVSSITPAAAVSTLPATIAISYRPPPSANR